MGHPCVGPVELLPGDSVAWRKMKNVVEDGALVKGSRGGALASDI